MPLDGIKSVPNLTFTINCYKYVCGQCRDVHGDMYRYFGTFYDFDKRSGPLIPQNTQQSIFSWPWHTAFAWNYVRLTSAAMPCVLRQFQIKFMNFNNKLRCIPIVCCVKVWLQFQKYGIWVGFCRCKPEEESPDAVWTPRDPYYRILSIYAWLKCVFWPSNHFKLTTS